MSQAYSRRILQKSFLLRSAQLAVVDVMFFCLLPARWFCICIVRVCVHCGDNRQAQLLKLHVSTAKANALRFPSLSSRP